MMCEGESCLLIVGIMALVCVGLTVLLALSDHRAVRWRHEARDLEATLRGIRAREMRDGD